MRVMVKVAMVITFMSKFLKLIDRLFAGTPKKSTNWNGNDAVRSTPVNETSSICGVGVSIGLVLVLWLWLWLVIVEDTYEHVLN